MTIRLFYAPAAAGKTQYCIEHVRTVRQASPLSPIWVIVSDASQVRAFRRRLARAGGAFNVQVSTFPTLYPELLAQAGKSWPRLGEPVLHRLLQAIVDDLVSEGQLDYYASLQDKPGFYHALRDVIRELKRAGVRPGELAKAATVVGPRLQEGADIYDRYQRWLQRERWSDDEGRGWLVREALAQQSELCSDWRLLVVDGFDEFDPTQLAVLEHLAQQGQETLATITGAPEPRLAHRRFDRARRDLERALDTVATLLPEATVHLAEPLAYLESALFEADTPSPPASSEALTLLEAPNRAQEVRAALRWLKKRHVEDGFALRQMAVLARDLQAYRPFLEETAAEFGLPLQMSGGAWLHQNPAVTALLDLLSLPRLDWPRRLLLEAWRSPYFDWSNEGITAGDADLLEAVAREGQVIAGLEQWHEALERLVDASERAEREDVADEEMDDLAALTAPRGSLAASLLQKLDAFVWRLQPAPQATLRQYVAWLETLIGDDPARTPPEQSWELGDSLGVVNRARYDELGETLSTAERDVAALQRLKDVLRSLVFAESALGAAQPVPYRRFWQELRGAVEASHYRLSPPEQEALLVAPVLGARGLTFRAVALLGLSEGEFPRRPPQEPLLWPTDREMLTQRGISLQLRDAGDEVTLFYEAVTRADRQLLVTRAYLADDGQPWEPSPYWEQLLRHSSVDVESIRSTQALPPADAASGAEFLTALAHSLRRAPGQTASERISNRLSGMPALAGAWKQVQAGATVLAARTAAQAHSPYEGDLSHIQPLLARRYGPEQPWSASRLEHYGLCAYSFFAGYALGLEPREPVEAGYDVRQLGSMYHAILEEAYERTAATGAAAEEVLPDVAQREFDAAPEKYGFRPTPLWQRQREELTQILMRTVAALDAESDGWQAIRREPPFGLSGRPPLAISDDRGRSLHLRGYIDRVDADEKGRLRVIDYKSSSTPISSRALAEGKRIQLALYALAARDALALGEPVAGMYWHIGSARPSHLRLEGYEGGVAAALETAVEYALSYAEGIRQGQFAPQPPDGGCPTWCPAADFCWRYTPRSF